MNDDVRDAAWILVHRVDDFRTAGSVLTDETLADLFDRADLFAAVYRRYRVTP